MFCKGNDKPMDAKEIIWSAEPPSPNRHWPNSRHPPKTLHYLQQEHVHWHRKEKWKVSLKLLLFKNRCVFFKLFALFFVLNITSALLFRPQSAAVKLSNAGILLSQAKAKCLLGWVLWLSRLLLATIIFMKLHYWNPQGWSAAAGVVANTTFVCMTACTALQVLNICTFIVRDSINLNALCTGG